MGVGRQSDAWQKAAMETGRRFLAATCGGGATQESLDAGEELAERGARRAVTNIWGRLHAFSQLGVRKQG